jgi:spore germination protein KA
VITIKIIGERTPKELPKPEESTDQPKETTHKPKEINKTFSISNWESQIKSIFHDSSDMIIEAFDTTQKRAMIVAIDGLVSRDLMDRDIITPLKSQCFDGDIFAAIMTNFQVTETLTDAIESILNGNVAVFYEGMSQVITIDFKQWDKRSVDTPDSESVTRGPKEGFIENLRTNTSLIRRKIKNPNLVFEDLTFGKETKTQILLAYIQGTVNQEVLKELKTRLSKIQADAVLESGLIEQYIDHNTLSPVSGVGITQKPDIVATRLLEGKVAIVCDGTPHVLTVPELFFDNLHFAEDRYNRVMLSGVMRILRGIGLFIGVMLPGLSVAIITYNQEMIPEPFFVHLVTATQKTPLPTAAEAFFLILMFELLRGSGTRLPKTVGSAITIVGSLIIGDAAVSAGIVGAPMVIIIALTAVASFVIPNLEEFILVYRLFFLVLGATMGLLGIGAGVVIMLTQLIATESFGIPIMSAFTTQEQKKSIFSSIPWIENLKSVLAKVKNAVKVKDESMQ